MEEMLRILSEIGESLKKLSQDAETRSRSVLGLTEIMEGRALQISREWESKVAEACEKIAQTSGSAEYLQGNARDALQLLSRMIEELRKIQSQSRARERSRIIWTSILTGCLTSLLSPLIWLISQRLL